MLSKRNFLVLALFSTIASVCARSKKPDRTVVQIHNAEYEKYCGAASDKKHPCFTLWSGDMTDVHMEVFVNGTQLPVKDVVLVKDDKMLDFTVRPPFDSFEVNFLSGDQSKLRCARHQPKDGDRCFDLTLDQHSDAWRIWLSDDVGDDRDLDTLHYPVVTKTFCDNKWFHVHVKKDGL